MSRRLRARLTWTAQAKGLLAALEPGAPEGPDFDMPIAPRERAVALLHLGSEIEHALMVQYLYAAYSLNAAQPVAEHRRQVARWREVIAEIAREEMGHLASVQNLLTLIGGPLCFEREDYPIIDPDLWPFPFDLEPLSKDSLAKYVLAEAPEDDVLRRLGLLEEFQAIRRRLKVEDSLSINRVGKIYAAIYQLFDSGPLIEGPLVPGAPKPFPFVPTVDIQADSLPYQVSPAAWGLGNAQILIRTAADRTHARAAIAAVSIQGEGPMTGSDDDLRKEFETSHCRRFLDVYRQFPEAGQWQPARQVAKNPTTNPEAEAGRRVRGAAVPWAQLANLRYRMLLTYLEHSFYIEAPTTQPGRSPRAALVSWCFGEMYNLRSLSEILMALPLAPGSAVNAGPPFEMPYTLALATRSVNRWRGHRDLLLASLELLERMLADPARDGERDRYLIAMRTADRTALDQIEALIGA